MSVSYLFIQACIYVYADAVCECFSVPNFLLIDFVSSTKFKSGGDWTRDCFYIWPMGHSFS